MSCTLPAAAASVSRARHRVVDLLHANGCPEDRVDEAALMTTELAANAVEHARTPFTVMVEVSADRLRVDVRDGSRAMPVVSSANSDTSIGGRGLWLVAAFADRWGCEPVESGKTVWFESANL
jgi:anti-sigma regulatory factor (Ser/Thr protein kinase)